MERIARPLLFIAIIIIMAVSFAAVVTATDTDSGDDPRHAGICRDKWENNDTCLADVLLEFYPNGSSCNYTFHNCPLEFPGTKCRTDYEGLAYCR